jgi:hypothetical protein
VIYDSSDNLLPEMPDLLKTGAATPSPSFAGGRAERRDGSGRRRMDGRQRRDQAVRLLQGPGGHQLDQRLRLLRYGPMVGTRAIYGMNFQTVSAAEKLKNSPRNATTPRAHRCLAATGIAPRRPAFGSGPDRTLLIVSSAWQGQRCVSSPSGAVSSAASPGSMPSSRDASKLVRIPTFAASLTTGSSMTLR